MKAALYVAKVGGRISAYGRVSVLRAYFLRHVPTAILPHDWTRKEGVPC